MPNIQNIAVRVTYHLSQWIGKQHAPFARKHVTSRDYFDAVDRLKPGHILLANRFGELSNMFIPGYWKHAAIFCMNGKMPCVVEATGKGVVETNLIDFMLSRDEVAIFEPTFADDRLMARAAAWARMNIGKPYDYEFRSNNDAFYCSELILSSYNRASGGAINMEMRERLGQMTVIPQDIADAEAKFLCLWHSQIVSHEVC